MDSGSSSRGGDDKKPSGQGGLGCFNLINKQGSKNKDKPIERAPEAVRLDVTDRRRGSNHNYPPMGSDYLHHPDDSITGLPEFTGIPNPPMAKAPEFQGPRSAGNS
ncbi:hypothetical protein PVAP13_9NG413600 [Panicum virgatum]|uniref:Uncharacterized protein n=1 Tax=Panicum virgatum TaxID=38727 RepID=A0A8T0MQS3_PANVG|nr:hypothetical protein PVAP13_9NG413600 [Panicum virgatum]